MRVVGFDVLTDGAVQAPSDPQDNQQEQDNLARKIVVSHRFVSGLLAIAWLQFLIMNLYISDDV